MGNSIRLRAVLLLSLLALLFGLLVWHGSLEPDPSVWAFPGADEIAEDYGSHVGERVTLSGTVLQMDPLIIAVDYGVEGVLNLRIQGVGDSVRMTVGDRLNVYGIVELDRTIRAINVVRVPRSGLWYTYGISFFAGLWMLGRIARYWHVDWPSVTIRPRTESLQVWSWLRSRVVAVVENDA